MITLSCSLRCSNLSPSRRSDIFCISSAACELKPPTSLEIFRIISDQSNHSGYSETWNLQVGSISKIRADTAMAALLRFVASQLGASARSFKHKYRVIRINIIIATIDWLIHSFMNSFMHPFTQNGKTLWRKTDEEIRSNERNEEIEKQNKNISHF